MYGSSAAAFFFLIVFFLRNTPRFNSIPLEASEKNVVWMLIFIFLYVHVFQGDIRTVLVNIVFSS